MNKFTFLVYGWLTFSILTNNIFAEASATPSPSVSISNTTPSLLTPTAIRSVIPQRTISPQDVFYELSNPTYRELRLPQDFSYLNVLLGHSSKTEQPRTQSVLTLQLFSKLIKGCTWIHPLALSQHLKEVTPIYKELVAYSKQGAPAGFVSYDTLDRLQLRINPLILGRFSAQYDQFKTNPTLFIDRLTNDIIATALDETQRDSLRQMVLRFLEPCLSKLVWSPDEADHIWPQVKMIADQLHELNQCGVINDLNDLDDLYWSIVHRLVYIVDAIAADLPEKFYANTIQDVLSNSCMLLSLEEQEPFLESKRSCLVRNLRLCYAKRHAFASGMLIS